jgi:ribosomal protein S27AE
MTQIKFTLKCPQCGGTRFKGATAKPGPNDPVTCVQCGTIVDLAAEKQRLEKEARRAVDERLRDQSE